MIIIIIFSIVVLGIICYIVVTKLSKEGHDILRKWVSCVFVHTTGDEDRLFGRNAQPIRRRVTLNYDIPLDLFDDNENEDELAPPPMDWDGINPNG